MLSVNTPFWSAYTEAFHKQDIQWISNVNRKLKMVWLILSLVSLIQLLLGNTIYKLWVGERIDIPTLLSICMFVYVLELSWGSIYVSFINGVGKIKLQLIISIITGILNIPLSIFFAKYLSLGISGVILATTACLFYGVFFARVQYNKILKGIANGIWNA